MYKNADTDDIVYIGGNLPDEYTGSNYTFNLKGTLAKAKANASQGIPEMIEIAGEKRFTQNRKTKHMFNAANGWYRYDTRFALPVYDNEGEVERYNVFHAYIIVRHDSNGRKYLYDVINIKKEASNPLCHQET